MSNVTHVHRSHLGWIDPRHPADRRRSALLMTSRASGFSRAERHRALGSFYTQGCRVEPAAFEVRKRAEKGALVGCETEHDGHESRETNPSSGPVDRETRRTNPDSKFDEHKTRRTNPDSGSLRSRNATNEPSRRVTRPRNATNEPSTPNESD